MSRPPSYARIAVFVLGAQVVVRLPFRFLSGWLESLPRRESGADASLERTSQRVERVLARLRPVTRHTCYARGVTRYYFLRRAGADVRLVFGLGTVQGAYEGHCWVEQSGEPYREPRDPRPIFTSVYAVPSRGHG
jgi:Transglutaminase-like superfamily